MTNKNPHEDSSCPVEQDVLEESSEEILEEIEQNSENGFSLGFLERNLSNFEATQQFY